jgi:hypothetical protein
MNLSKMFANKRKSCNNCHVCLEGVYTEYGFPLAATGMIVCPGCGNKRCPKATDHTKLCSGSNESGQEGSIYNKQNT